MVPSHETFYFSFLYISKVPIWSPDSNPKFVMNKKSNSPRYSNYSSLCVDSVKAELIFSLKLHKTFGIFLVILVPFEHFMVHFYKSYRIPLKVLELVMYACFGLIHLPHTESMRSETPRQLSRCRVRLHDNWVNAVWDSTSTESTQKAPTFTKIWSFRVNSVDVESHSTLTQST